MYIIVSVSYVELPATCSFQCCHQGRHCYGIGLYRCNILGYLDRRDTCTVQLYYHCWCLWSILNKNKVNVKYSTLPLKVSQSVCIYITRFMLPTEQNILCTEFIYLCQNVPTHSWQSHCNDLLPQLLNLEWISGNHLLLSITLVK